jgi:hypothetical protein
MTCSEVFPPRSIIYLPSTFYGQPFDIPLSSPTLTSLRLLNLRAFLYGEGPTGGAANP